MGPYLALLKIRIAVLFSYRAALFASTYTQLFWAMVYLMILKGFYAGASSEEPLSLSQAITFIWLGQSLIPLLPWSVDREIESQIRSGHVAYELIRPLHLYLLWFIHSLAMKILPTLIRGIPVIWVASFFGFLQPPVSFASFIGFLASVVSGTLVATALTTCIVVSLFWTLAGDGIKRLLPSMAVLFSGSIVPLPLFPDWLQPVLNLQPFRCMLDIPCRLYTGIIPASEIPFYLAFQLIWALVLIALGRYFLYRAMRKFVIQGG